MADELQALLDKINDEGVKKARQEQDEIIAKAKKEAEAIIADAREQAAKITADASRDAAVQLKEGMMKLRHASRDIILNLRANLQNRVRQSVSDLMKETLDGEKLASVIANVITEYIAKNGNSDDLTVLVNESQLATLESAVKAKLAADLKERCTIAPGNVTSGFKLVFTGNDVMYDFSDQALTDTIAAFIGPKLTAALNE